MLIFVLDAIAAVAAGGLSPDLEAHLASPVVAGALVGIYAENARGDVLVDLQSDRRFVPASNQKVLTMLYAFERLGPDFRPRVSIWKEPDRLVVDAPGHPLLTGEELRDARRRLGVRPGTPVHVRQAYRPDVPPSWEHDDLPHRYASAVTAFTVDRGAFEVRA